MRHVMVRYTVKPEHVEHNEALIRAVFAELDRLRPADVRYASYRVGDDGAFVHVTSSAGERSPLLELAAFREFQQGISERCSQQPVVSELHAIGSFDGFDRAD
jgi:hypothetical protein